jgi:hypothetical protein
MDNIEGPEINYGSTPIKIFGSLGQVNVLMLQRRLKLNYSENIFTGTYDILSRACIEIIFRLDPKVSICSSIIELQFLETHEKRSAQC